MNCPRCGAKVSHVLFRCPRCQLVLPPPPGAQAGPGTPNYTAMARSAVVMASGDRVRRALSRGLWAAVAIFVALAFTVAADVIYTCSFLRSRDELGVAWTVVLIGQALTTLIAVGLFLLWLYQARVIMDFFPDVPKQWSLGWTMGGWFIPVANLVLGGAVVADLARTGAESPQDERILVGRVWRWWTIWLSTHLVNAYSLNYLARRLARAVEPVAEWIDKVPKIPWQILLAAPGVILSVVAAVLAARVIFGINTVLRTRVERVAATGYHFAS